MMHGIRRLIGRCGIQRGSERPCRLVPAEGSVSLAILLVIATFAGYHNRNVIDDGFIYFRIVQNVVDPTGPVFNAGERVEVYTSPAWLAVLSAGDGAPHPA